MFKVQVVVLDIIGNSLEWLNANADESHMDLCEIITLEKDSPIAISDLASYENWDILLVFEMGLRDKISNLLKKCNIEEDRILYPLDIYGSLLQKPELSAYLFNDEMRETLRYLSFRTQKEPYVIGHANGMTYVNTSEDNIILPHMYIQNENWSKSDMEVFFDLAHKYYSFKDSQSVFCDIGANIGTTCLYFKKHLDSHVRILAFEPLYENYKMLTVNALLNDISPADNRFVQMGVSDTNNYATMSYNPQNPGASTLSLPSPTNGEQISLTTFDDYITSEKIDITQIKYFWVDVEGFEARFLKGAHQTLSQIKVPMFMEFTPRLYANREGEFELLISELSDLYDSYIIAQSPDMAPQPICNLTEKQNDMEFEADLFLIKY